ncbi:hypothetical protein GCM10022202_28050 [Microbacterium marinilacus]|uniref:HTH-like domain-containing protein n=1 Tax=Microbacterium marinilacus TaxID=415209 RepID=A0ABP7BNL4_9MICO
MAEAYRANALFDAHDDPEFGHRCLVDEAADRGEIMSVRTAWRICRHNGWWSSRPLSSMASTLRVNLLDGLVRIRRMQLLV